MFQIITKFLRFSFLVLFFAIIINALLPLTINIPQNRRSTLLYSSQKNLLRLFREEKSGSYSQWRILADHPIILQQAIILAEDKRFFLHPGLDPLAFMRAAWQNITSPGIVSGASTISQQVARILYKDRWSTQVENRYLRKLSEMLMAIRLELWQDKKSILEFYLNLVPVRDNQIGFAAASHHFFAKDLKILNDGECIALAVLVRQPQATTALWQARVERLAKKMHNAGFIDRIPDDPWRQVENGGNASFVAMTTDQPTAVIRNRYSRHFQSFFRQRFAQASGIIDSYWHEDINKYIHSILQTELKILRANKGEEGAVVVLQFPSSSDSRLRLIAMVGSKNFDHPQWGQVNGVTAVRSAGSALKPLLYAQWLSQKSSDLSELIFDRPLFTSTGYWGQSYQPRNNDLQYWGKITLYEALTNSRNVPAVSLIERLGVGHFLRYLRDAGFDHLRSDATHYGPSLALGTGGASLLQICHAYAALANGGVRSPLFIASQRFSPSSEEKDLVIGDSRRLMSLQAAEQITFALSDREIRRRAFGQRNFLDFPFDVAAKTGTSKDYRDSWTIGYTPEYAVCVWVGNFSGQAMHEVSGAWGAGRIFHETVRVLARQHHKKRFSYSAEARKIRICRLSGLQAGPDCLSLQILSHNPQPKICPGAHHSDTVRPIRGYNTRGHDQGQSDDQKDCWQSGIQLVSPAVGEQFILDANRVYAKQKIPLEIGPCRSIAGLKNLQWRLNGGIKQNFGTNYRHFISANPGEHLIEIFVDERLAISRRFYVR